MRSLLCAIFVILCFKLAARCQVHVENAHISGKIKTFSVSHPTERAYLQFDKPYYAAGDTMYFKAYVTVGGDYRLSGLSGVLHVELVNTKGGVDQSIKLQLNDGIAWGDFALPDSLPAGNYRVVAYTRWMRNEGEDAFFDRPIAVGSLFHARIPESGLPASKLNGAADVQFFPEGGGMVVGVTSKVAFKAIGTDGLGTDVNGVVTDDEHKEITRFASVHLGMGSFSFRPEAGKTYSAKVIYPNGISSMVMLPQASEKGIVLSVNNDSIPKAVVRIVANKACYQENKNKVYSLLVWSGGNIITVPCTLDSTIITLDILKRRLKTGIATLTLFSPTGEPLCERLIFVQNYDQLSLNIASDKTTYGKREKVTLTLNAKTRADSAAMGYFSVSVTDESKVPVDERSENTILTGLLLTADLKGYIEQPNYYFSTTNDKTQSDLDLVMLTHGYRRFNWKQILNDQDKTLAYQPEKGIEINGIAKNVLGKPLANGTVTLLSTTAGLLQSMQTDDKGHFTFDNLAFTDSVKFILQAVTAKGKNLTTLVYNKEKEGLPSISPSPEASEQPELTYLENSLKQHDQAVQYGTATGRMLKEVKIRNTKIDAPKIDNRYGIAGQVISGDKILYGGSLAVRLMGLIRGVHFIPSGGNRFRPVLNRPATKPMLIVWNGNEMPASFDINAINTGSIENIEVITDPTASSPDYDGVIIVNTAFGLRLKDISSTGILPINVDGFYKAREFYAPRYDRQDNNLKRADLRSTVYWKPELQTGKDGKASFGFFNADGTGTYRVVVEGIDDKGNLGRQVYRYKVE
jgi:hypothetical protein